MKLIGFLKKLRNEQVTIELKNGSTVWGTLQVVSPQMNATLTDVTLSLPQPRGSRSANTALAGVYLAGGRSGASDTSSSVSLQYINIRGNTIRQIILPDSLNLDSLLVDDQQFNSLRKAGRISADHTKKRRGDHQQHTAKRPKRAL